MITILFLVIAALGGWAIGRRTGYHAGSLYGARYAAQQLAPMIDAARNETARAIIADAQAAMADAEAATRRAA